MRVLESVWGVQLRQEDTLQPGKLDRPLRKLSGGGIGWKSWTVEPGVCVHARVHLGACSSETRCEKVEAIGSSVRLCGSLSVCA